MKALVVGAAGQVGRALTRTAPLGDSVVALDRAACDIADGRAVAAALDFYAPDIVFIAAGYTAVDRAETEPQRARLINTVAPAQLAALARARGSRTVHISTDFVFDGQSGRPYRPSDPAHPLNVYGRTKLEGEEGVAAADSSALIVRSAWIYDAQGANFLNTMLKLMVERGPLRVVTDQIGTPTHAASLARALWALARSDAAGIHHFTDAGVASWYDFAVAIGEEALACGVIASPPGIEPVNASEFPRPAPRPAYSVLDKTSTWRLTGPPPHWRTNLRAALQEIAPHG